MICIGSSVSYSGVFDLAIAELPSVEKIIRTLERRHLQSMAVRFGVSERCVRGLVRRQRESGGVTTKAHGGGAVALATSEKLAALEARVAAHNNHTIAEHHAHLLAAGYRQSTATVGRWLLGLGLTRKKTARDDEAKSERVRNLRAA